MGLVQKAFSDIITFSRSSNATRIGPTGLVEYAPHNLLVRSQEFDNASWTKTRSSVTANATAAPDGTVTADTIVEDTTATNSHVIFQSASLGAGLYTASCYFKKNTRSFACLRISTNNDAQRYSVTINLDTGAFGSTSSSGSPTSTSYVITNAGNGWYRLSVTTAHSSGLVYATLAVSDAASPTYDGSALPIYTGDGTSGIFIWGAQLSVGPYALDYTPTTSAAVYGPRFDYDPVTLAARGLLVEEQRTNLLVRSEEFDNAAWTKVDCTASANATTSPDGTVTADQITEVLNTSNNLFNTTFYANSAGQAMSASVFLKYLSRRYVQVVCGGAADGFGCVVDLVGKTITATGTKGSSTYSSSTITELANGWVRVTINGILASSNTGFLALRSSDASTWPATTLPVITGQNAYYAWGAQLEAGSFATSYIPTLASTVTRSADVASVNTLSPWFSATEGSLYAEVSYASVAQSFPLACSLDNSTTSYISLSKDTTNSTSFTALVVDAGSTQATMSTANAVTANGVVKGAVGYKANDFGFSVNGNTAVTDTSGTVPTVTKLSIGSQSSFNATNGWIRRIAYYPRKLSSAELQALSA